MDILKIDNLSKSFGSNKVLDDLSFSVKEGSVFGFIGQNGAGKTTTMKIILGLLAADSGSALIDGTRVKYGNTPTNKVIGYLPDVPSFYGYMRPMEYLRLCGDISGMEKDLLKERSALLLDMVGLGNAKKKISGFSRGMKQRLGIAQALLSQPRLLICDEPTSALDPVGRKEILDILESIREKTTVIFSTHVLSDVERICDDVALLHRGRIAFSGPLADIKKHRGHDTISLEFADAQAAAKLVMLVKKLYDNAIDILHCDIDTDIYLSGNKVSIKTSDIDNTEANLLKLMSHQQLLPIKMEVEEPTLENLFMEVIK